MPYIYFAQTAKAYCLKMKRQACQVLYKNEKKQPYYAQCLYKLNSEKIPFAKQELWKVIKIARKHANLS